MTAPDVGQPSAEAVEEMPHGLLVLLKQLSNPNSLPGGLEFCRGLVWGWVQRREAHLRRQAIEECASAMQAEGMIWAAEFLRALLSAPHAKEGSNG